MDQLKMCRFINIYPLKLSVESWNEMFKVYETYEI